MAPRHTIGFLTPHTLPPRTVLATPTVEPCTPYDPLLASTTAQPSVNPTEWPFGTYIDYYTGEVVGGDDHMYRFTLCFLGALFLLIWVIIVTLKVRKLKLGTLFPSVRRRSIVAFSLLSLAWWVVAFVMGPACLIAKIFVYRWEPPCLCSRLLVKAVSSPPSSSSRTGPACAASGGEGNRGADCHSQDNNSGSDMAPPPYTPFCATGEVLLR